MKTARWRIRDIVDAVLVPAGIILAICPCLFGLDQSLDVSQYVHTSWKIREGFTKGTVSAIAQTPDGYLWLGTEFGLLRFDGVKAVPWQPPQGQHLPSERIYNLLAARDGTLWIGTTKGLASWRDGKLTQYPTLAGQSIRAQIVEDYEGTVWAGSLAAPPFGKLCAIGKGGVQCYGDEGSLGSGVGGLYQDHNRNLWVGVRNGLWRWKPGAPQFYPAPGPPNGIEGMAESEDGSLLFGPRTGITRVVGGKTEAYPLPGNVPEFTTALMLRDRDAGLWIGTSDAGLVHLHRGRTDLFRQADGLSGDFITSLFTDREGSVWVATDGGLDRFREAAAATISLSQGLSNASILSVLADRDGSVWLATRRGLNHWNNGQITVLGNEAFHGTYPGSLFMDSRGRVWVSTIHDFGYLNDSRFLPLKKVPGGVVYAIAEDSAGTLWIANKELGLIRLGRDGQVGITPWTVLGHKDPALAISPDPLRGGLWVGFRQGGIEYFESGQVKASYSSANGLGAGRVNDLLLEADGTLWAGTEGGLSLIKNGRAATLTTRNGMPCDSTHWVREDGAHSFWMYTTCGLVRVARSELDAWAGAEAGAAEGRKETAAGVHAAVFDNSDGVRSLDDIGGYTPHVARGSDGKLWFLPSDGVSIVDPSHLPFNQLPPPVLVEQITADRHSYNPKSGGSVHLPPLARDLEIDYTALSFVAPEKVRFRYMLEGWDQSWQDAGTRRQAFYTNLSPRNYRFRVSACNNSGVWNDAGGFVDFVIDPAWYQTGWFVVSCTVASIALLVTLYRLRVNHVEREFNLRVEERVGERTRIARDLHDTLLQSLAGVSLQLEGISKLAATQPERTPSLISHVREQVNACFREARLKVWDLRSPALASHGLTAALNGLVERIGIATSARCGVAVSGSPRPCPPEVEEELLRIAQEAASNATRHAQANEIRIALDYGETSLTLSVCDDGKGFDPEEGYRKSGHWGLKNMQERAAQVRGTCSITTAAGQGTQIEIRVPLSSSVPRNAIAKQAR
jgi:signal transduction histidine kinase/ligand-binding sensor domain-containing protein